MLLKKNLQRCRHKKSIAYIYILNSEKMKRLTLLLLALFAAFGQLWAQEQTEQMVTYLTKADFLKKIVDYEKNPTQWIFLGDKPCIIDFYADWCRPCRIASPILEDLAEQYKGQINVYKVNTDREKELSAAFGIQSIPAFLFCPLNGTPQMSAGIAQTAEETQAIFKKIIDEFLLKK